MRRPLRWWITGSIISMNSIIWKKFDSNRALMIMATSWSGWGQLVTLSDSKHRNSLTLAMSQTMWRRKFRIVVSFTSFRTKRALQKSISILTACQTKSMIWRIAHSTRTSSFSGTIRWFGHLISGAKSLWGSHFRCQSRGTRRLTSKMWGVAVMKTWS